MQQTIWTAIVREAGDDMEVFTGLSENDVLEQALEYVTWISNTPKPDSPKEAMDMWQKHVGCGVLDSWYFTHRNIVKIPNDEYHIASTNRAECEEWLKDENKSHIKLDDGDIQGVADFISEGLDLYNPFNYAMQYIIRGKETR